MKKAGTQKAAPKDKKVDVSGRLTIQRAQELKDLLAKEVQRGSGIVLSMADDDEMDVAGAQVLLAARKSAMGSSQQVKFPEKMPDSIIKWLTRAALCGDLGNGGE
jgi:anti-anti-sigma regulatory factor